MPQDTNPTFDMKPTHVETSHTSRTIILWASVIVVIIGAVYVGLSIRERRAREAYIRTPEGQLEALEATSTPDTATPEERAQLMVDLQKSSGVTEMNQEDLVKQLPAAE